MSSKKLNLLITLIFFVLFSGCAVAPRGNYYNSKIERPYALPDDIAITSFEIKGYRDSFNDSSKSATGRKEKEQKLIPKIRFENGISQNVSWIYPLGLRWGLYQGETHTFGLKAFTLLLISDYSFDYWYRLNSSVSIRPYYRGKSLDLFFVKESRNFTGVEFLYQATNNLAISIYGNSGNYKTSSPLIEAILNGATGSDDFSTELSGTFKQIGFNGFYSINEQWDFYTIASAANYKLKDFEIKNITANFGLNYIW